MQLCTITFRHDTIHERVPPEEMSASTVSWQDGGGNFAALANMCAMTPEDLRGWFSIMSQEYEPEVQLIQLENLVHLRLPPVSREESRATTNGALLYLKSSLEWLNTNGRLLSPQQRALLQCLQQRALLQ